MPTMNESIYETHTQLFTPQFYNNIKTLTEVRKMQKYGGHSRLTKSEFDKYLMILFTMMISGKERGSVQDNWSKNTKIRNQFIADEVGMSCREWEEIHSNVCYGHIKLLLDQPEEEIDTNQTVQNLMKKNLKILTMNMTKMIQKNQIKYLMIMKKKF
ncbi:Hypothetical_protein [Hexamita inflata]|uniref:Hypothetical_protein n=1 Tax=Hexamita inflata TaxID=28002 RepID=A0AA86UGV4_9EUKA|nr:Hypothetical protein HINF_LOCUS43004 [Hexamita inflata]